MIPVDVTNGTSLSSSPFVSWPTVTCEVLSRGCQRIAVRLTRRAESYHSSTAKPRRDSAACRIDARHLEMAERAANRRWRFCTSRSRTTLAGCLAVWRWGEAALAGHPVSVVVCAPVVPSVRGDHRLGGKQDVRERQALITRKASADGIQTRHRIAFKLTAIPAA